MNVAASPQCNELHRDLNFSRFIASDAQAARLETLSQMASSMVLELRQSLAVIATDCTTSSILLSKTSPDLSKVFPLLDRIAECVQRATDVILPIDLAAVRREPTCGEIDVVNLLRETAQIVSSEGVARGVTVKCLQRGPSAIVLADKFLLQQAFVAVLVILMRTAVSSSPATPRALEIDIALRSQTLHIVFPELVYSEGHECHPGDPAKVFGVNNQDGHHESLKACEAILEAHRGGISANERPEGGFVVTLPIHRLQSPETIVFQTQAIDATELSGRPT
ncbi:HAMP domain-containing histidine kinase [Pararhizobium arenae]|uniref:HAMP domain-containing histidine kinase n=1 Tax=Pararhizobium arenae TaxID=1856850 RepID=UPI000AD4F1A7|nr:HAMP domain-containing histidine kinase [Pararhizobium arenae]